MVWFFKRKKQSDFEHKIKIDPNLDPTLLAARKRDGVNKKEVSPTIQQMLRNMNLVNKEECDLSDKVRRESRRAVQDDQ